MDEQEYQDALSDFGVESAGEDTSNVKPTDPDAWIKADLEKTRRALDNSVQVERLVSKQGVEVEQVQWPFHDEPILDETEWLPCFATVSFRPLRIERHEQCETAYKMLTRYGHGRGGFDADEPVPSLWYADIRALHDGMRTRVEDYAETYKQQVLEPVGGVIRKYLQAYQQKHGRMPPLEEQYHLEECYKMISKGTDWGERIEHALFYLMTEKHMARIKSHVHPDHFGEGRGRIANLQCRDGLLLEMRPTLLQWNAAGLALGSIATGQPIHDLPAPTQSPFAGKEKSLKDARAIVTAFKEEVRGMKNPKAKHLNVAIEQQGVDATNARKNMRDTMGLSVGQDYTKGDVAEYVNAVRALLMRHEGSKANAS